MQLATMDTGKILSLTTVTNVVKKTNQLKIKPSYTL